MKISPKLELSILNLGLALTIPALVADYSEEFDTGTWEAWIKLTPYLFYITAQLVGMYGFMKHEVKWLDAGWPISLIGLLCCYFLMMFNTRSASQVVCDEWNSICLDDFEGSCDTDFEAWQGFTYILGLCLCIIGGSLVFLLFLEKSISLKKSMGT